MTTLAVDRKKLEAETLIIEPHILRDRRGIRMLARRVLAVVISSVCVLTGSRPHWLSGRLGWRPYRLASIPGG